MSMNELRCEGCGLFFDERNTLKTHSRGCSRLVFKKGPSFKYGLSKKQIKVRQKIEGSYEWALAQSNSITPKRLKKLLNEKSAVALEKEIQRLESQVAFSNLPVESDIKRLIAFSHAYIAVNRRVESLNVSQKVKQTNEQLRKVKERARKEKERARKKAVKEMNAKLKPDVEKTGDIMDVYFKSGERAVTSGGLPSLGKR
ncbi:hypothetical protein [Vibrio cortegadensis]|uniref:hypothetical protein n=1 Tax=Vibrio cortegadensis TaxID=1328770 RepID=UPI00352C4544